MNEMASQFDPLSLIPARSGQWRRLLATVKVARVVTVYVCPLWTGEVVEALQDTSGTRWFLMKSGLVRDIEPNTGRIGRTVFATIDTARRWHASAPMIRVGTPRGSSVRYRFARPGESAPEHLEG